MRKENQLRFAKVLGSSRILPFGSISKVTKNDFLGFYRLSFKDGKNIRISKDMHGMEQSLAKLPRRNF